MNGWIILDKPLGMSSTQASSLVRRLTGSKKAGHAGTLDPLASGILPIALDEATKTIPYCVCDEKVYEFQIRWGIQTATDDMEGEAIAQSELRPTEEAIRQELPNFKGEIQQVPPIYAAVKVDGRRAYDLARKGEIVNLKSRQVTIFDFELLSIDDGDHATFRVRCGTGTYVRSLARDLSLSLGTVGHVSRLRRTKVGRFSEEMSISLEIFREIVHKCKVADVLLPLGAVLDDIPAVTVLEEDAAKIRKGQPIYVQVDHDFVALWHEEQVIGLAKLKDKALWPIRVFNL